MAECPAKNGCRQSEVLAYSSWLQSKSFGDVFVIEIGVPLSEPPRWALSCTVDPPNMVIGCSLRSAPRGSSWALFVNHLAMNVTG